MNLINTTSEKKCHSCGLPLRPTDMGASLCSYCTLNNTQTPVFDAVVFAIAEGYFMIKQGFSFPKIAIQKAWDFVTKNPYWASRPEEWASPELLEPSFAKMRIDAKIVDYLYNLDESILAQEVPDLFISHTWHGPDTELVDPLVARLKSLGYKVWYDKEQGLQPGELDQYLKDQIINARNCIPILCQQYFQSHNTLYELETIFRVKEKKHIFPVWWIDVDKDYLQKQQTCGEDVLNCAGITWENCQEDLDQLVTRLDNYLLESEDLGKYGDVELLDSERRTMQELEKAVGEKILAIDSAIDVPIDTLKFGFIAEANHVIGLVLRQTQAGRMIPPFTLPPSITRLRKLQHFSGRLLQIPAYLGNLTNLWDLDLRGHTSFESPRKHL